MCGMYIAVSMAIILMAICVTIGFVNLLYHDYKRDKKKGVLKNV